jgi:hypothetical protein
MVREVCGTGTLIPEDTRWIPATTGQQVAPGTNLARVAAPSRLKVELKIPETQAKDVQIGQRVSIDTRNGIIEGEVGRVDPSVLNGTVTVDVTLRRAREWLTGELPTPCSAAAAWSLSARGPSMPLASTG